MHDDDSTIYFLDRAEGSDHVVVLRVETTIPASEVYDRYIRARTGESTSEQDTVRSVAQGLAGTVYGDLLSELECGVPALVVWRPVTPDVRDDTSACLAGFYLYGWLIQYRLQRAQVAIELDGSRRSAERGLAQINNQRVRLINVERIFLTDNRSTLTSIQSLCDDLVARLDLHRRYALRSRTHRSLEQYLSNATSLSQGRRGRWLNFTVAVLTIAAVPATVLSAGMALSLSADLVERPRVLIGNQRVALVLVLSFLLPALCLALLAALEHQRGRVRDGS